MNAPLKDSLREGRPRGVAALLGSYAADIKRWLAKLAAGYGVAAALMLGGVLAVFGAVAVGLAALFDFLAHHYGTTIAFAVLGGGLLVFGAILLLIGLAVMKRRAPPLPRPARQLRAARQMLLGTTISRAVGALRQGEAAKPDATTQVLIGAAALLAVGWIAASHIGSRRRSGQVRR